MPRPRRCRAVTSCPRESTFAPKGMCPREREEIALLLDEFEAIRLADYEGLYQEEAARAMGVSRQTFGRIIESARKKVADMLVNGKSLRVVGGVVSEGPKGAISMKIAVPSRGDVIDAHFGHCEQYRVYTAENGQVVSEETVPSPAGCGCKSNIASTLASRGVTLMLAGNMGDGAVRVLSGQGIEVVRGCSGGTRAAVDAWLSGSLKDSGEVCHEHGDDHECAH